MRLRPGSGRVRGTNMNAERGLPMVISVLRSFLASFARPLPDCAALLDNFPLIPDTTTGHDLTRLQHSYQAEGPV